MALIVKRRSDRIAAARLLKQAQVKKTRTDSNQDYLMVCEKFVTAVHKVRDAMKKTGSTDFNNYDQFFGGFEQCDIMLQDEKYKNSPEARYAYELLIGADSWLKHEAEKLGEDYISPQHFYLAWWYVEHIWIDPKNPPPNN